MLTGTGCIGPARANVHSGDGQVLGASPWGPSFRVDGVRQFCELGMLRTRFDATMSKVDADTASTLPRLARAGASF